MWKENWPQTKERFVKWWNRDGLLVGMWGAPETAACIHEPAAAPATPATLPERWTNPRFRAEQNHYRLARSIFPLDVLPTASPDLGPGILAAYLGSEPGFAETTVWFHPVFQNEEEPENLPPLKFDPASKWWQTTEAVIRACVEKSRGKYFVGCPDLIENMDVLSSLRDAQTLCMDMLERPAWIEEKIAEINRVWFDAYQRIYDLIKLEDGSSVYDAFYLWGPGKVAKVQCDSSAMFSPQMYRRFVVPSLTQQCAWLDYSLYHLDGTQAVQHLDALLEIEPLDAIEWTPQAGIETGGHQRWHEMYKRILAAGKSVQVVNVELNEVQPLLDTLGPKGVYMLIQFKDEREAEQVARMVQPYY
ncbi:MAG: hypothetical protein U1F65_05485 [Verrucomicrobiota bacterium]